MRVLITICGRGGSIGIPKKNIKLLNGKPLIGYSIDFALNLKKEFNADIALSTDCDEIKNVAENFGLSTKYSRPAYMADSNTGKIEVIRALLNYEEENNKHRYHYIIDLDITSPLRTIEDVKSAFNKLILNKDALNIFSVSKANRNPYFNMVEENDKGYVKLVKNGLTVNSRQKAPIVYDLNASFYIYRREYFEMNLKSVITKNSLAFLMEHICFDIDEPIDFSIMEHLIKNNLTGISI